MHLKSQKRIASKLLKCGETRIRVAPDKDVEEALTRNDIRELIKNNLIKKIPKKGTSKAHSKKRKSQKKKGRKKSFGSRKGTMKARMRNDKKEWLEKVRPLRKMIKELRDEERVTKEDYTKIYRRIKGGFFRNKKHLMSYLKTNELIKKLEKKATKKVKTVTEKVKETKSVKKTK